MPSLRVVGSSWQGVWATENEVLGLNLQDKHICSVHYSSGKEFPLFSYRNGCFKVFQFLLSILFSKISLSLCLLNSRLQCITIISKGQGELYEYILFGLKKAFSNKSHSNIIFNNNLWIRYAINKLCCLNKYWNRNLKVFLISFLWKITCIYFLWNKNNKCVIASFPGCFSGTL